MSDFDETIWCTGCGVEILFTPYVKNQQHYCCQDCALGFSCDCGQAMEREENYRDAKLPTTASYLED
jgi:hypothetical protein